MGLDNAEYMMKHFKMAAANRDGETAALTKSNEGLRASNEELRRAHSELEAKYEVLAGMHNRLTGKGGAAASGAPAGPGDRAADCVAEAEILASRVEELIGAEYEDADCRRYVKRLRRERGHLFTFLEHDVDYHNNISKRGLRPFAASPQDPLRKQVGARGREDEDPDERVRDVQDARGQLFTSLPRTTWKEKRRRFRQAARRPPLPQPPDSRTARRAHGHVLNGAHH